jgi:hypothetical protein
MPTAWKIRDKTIGGSGPTWDAMSTDDTDDYDALTTHKWEWTSTWTIFAKSTDDTGIIWSSMPYTWENDPTVLNLNPWTVITNTRIQSDTTWSIPTNTKIQTATET